MTYKEDVKLKKEKVFFPKKSVMEIMIEDAVESQNKYGFSQLYTLIMTERNVLIPLPIKEVYKDGFLSGTTYYGMLPFVKITDETAKNILELEKAIKEKSN
jgi:hypothetical protein